MDVFSRSMKERTTDPTHVCAVLSGQEQVYKPLRLREGLPLYTHSVELHQNLNFMKHDCCCESRILKGLFRCSMFDRGPALIMS